MQSPPQRERATEQGARSDGRLAENIVYFARALRAAGIPVGPGAVLDALEAVKAAGVGTREDFYWTLHAVFVKRHEHSIIFDQAFRIFFRRRGYIDQVMAMMLPQAPNTPRPPEAGATRVHEALFSGLGDKLKKEQRDRARYAHDRVRPRSAAEKRLCADDGAEIAAAKEAMQAAWRCRSPRCVPAGSRRIRTAICIDIRRTLRASFKGGGDFIDLRFIGPNSKPPPIVALLDISGSMSQYSRLFLHFLHGLTDARKRVATFLFGTRLTNVTRAFARARSRRRARRLFGERARLVGRHPYRFLAHIFNKLWARRVLTQGAIVLLITDGLERDADDTLGLRDRPAAPLLPAARLAQSAAALRRLRGARPRHQDHAAACRRIPPDPQSRVDGGARRRAAGAAAGPATRRHGCGRSREHICGDCEAANGMRTAARYPAVRLQ